MVHRRWWLVVGVLFISMGVTGLAAAQLPARCPRRRPDAPGPTPPRPSRRAARPDASAPTPPALPTPPPVPTAPVPTAPAVTAPVPVAHRRVGSVRVDAVGVHPRGVGAVRLDAPGLDPVGAARSRRGLGRRRAPPGRAAQRNRSGSGATAARAPRPADPRRPTRRERRRRPAARGAPPPTAATATAAAAKVRRRDRALRRAVLRFQGCLSRVPRAERRVLTLRAGVGAARTHSRTEVARITHLRRTRVITLERRGLRHLHALGRTGACQEAPQPRPRRRRWSPPARRASGAAPPAGTAPSWPSITQRQQAGRRAGPPQAHRRAVDQPPPGRPRHQRLRSHPRLRGARPPRVPVRGHARGQAHRRPT